MGLEPPPTGTEVEKRERGATVGALQTLRMVRLWKAALPSPQRQKCGACRNLNSGGGDRRGPADWQPLVQRTWAAAASAARRRPAWAGPQPPRGTAAVPAGSAPAGTADPPRWAHTLVLQRCCWNVSGFFSICWDLPGCARMGRDVSGWVAAGFVAAAEESGRATPHTDTGAREGRAVAPGKARKQGLLRRKGDWGPHPGKGTLDDALLSKDQHQVRLYPLVRAQKF